MQQRRLFFLLFLFLGSCGLRPLYSPDTNASMPFVFAVTGPEEAQLAFNTAIERLTADLPEEENTVRVEIKLSENWQTFSFQTRPFVFRNSYTLYADVHFAAQPEKKRSLRQATDQQIDVNSFGNVLGAERLVTDSADALARRVLQWAYQQHEDGA